MIKNVDFSSNGRKLVGKLFYPEVDKHSYPAILFLHGWDITKNKDEEYSLELIKLGFVCFTFYMGGHGDSEGDRNKLSRADFLDDTVSAYDYFASLPQIDKKIIHVVGSSFGCYLATLLSGQRKIKSLLLRAPQNYPDDGFLRPKVLFHGEMLKDWRKKLLKSSDAKSLKALSRFNGKVLLMESEFDTFVSKQTYLNFKKAIPKNNLTYMFMKGFNHSIKSEAEKSRYVEILKEWFK